MEGGGRGGDARHIRIAGLSYELALSYPRTPSDPRRHVFDPWEVVGLH